MNENEYFWRLRVAAIDQDSARVYTRRHQFTVGRPLDFDAEYDRITALEHVLGALGAEIVSGLRVFAKRRRLELDHVEALVDGRLQNPLPFFEVVGETGHPNLSQVSVKVFVASPHDEDTMKRLWDDVLERLPLARTLGKALNLRIELALTS
jgi:hypothetical protein